MAEDNLFTRIGGRSTLVRVHKLFYDKVYGDEWLGLFFVDVNQEFIEDQQTDFMTQAMGGPREYKGATVPTAHRHIFATEELFDYRHEMLKEALIEAHVSAPLLEAWLILDANFKGSILKRSLSECTPRIRTGPIHNHPRPLPRRRAG